ncbi:MAG: glyoxylate/hydroxypyruvate reductase A, partial [Burkholderiaceae bacterium]|nr:glyoxylate/hydroxypyruvate reductase A [Burkholderiaceae bacterium]
GAHIVEEDLLALVRTGHIAGATLDVFREEPLPSSHPFWGEEKIHITPHISALTMREESAQQIAGKIRAIENGADPQKIVGLVDKTKGY